MDFFKSDTIRDIANNLKGRLWRKYSPWCKSLGWSHEQIQELLEDACTDGILAAEASLDKWDPEKSDIHYWCYLKARLIVRNRLAKAERRVGLIDDLVTESSPVSYEPIDDFILRDEMKGILAHLSPEQKEALSLYYLYEVKVNKIALIMGCELKTVYTLLDRGRKKARAYYQRLYACTELESSAAKGQALSRYQQCQNGGGQDTRPPPCFEVDDTAVYLSDLPT